MTEVDEKHVLNLDDYIDQNLYSVYGGISQVNIFLTPDANIDEIYKKLSNNLNYEVYKKDSIPKEYHYKNNVRIGDIMIVGKPGYTIVSSNTNVNWTFHHGDHGYSNIEPTMHPIFYAWGPAFKKSLNSEPFRNVDIYPLMCYVLNIPIRPTNGSIDNVKHLLKNYKSSSFLQQLILPANQAIPIVIIVLISVTIAIVYSIVSCGHAKKTVIIQKYVPIHYQLLGNNDDKKYTNNLVISDDDEG
ncbi:unnamed protein product [Didymodactylos carnosus]|uniref:Uncharacterized protein n=2 Tax=Didymodactylos carnosus TaxID=1234261 RepID=A0A8S2HP23_9BILA|nr:unnamed protein product [Didymodactylos carnosus]CAF3667395.1 unnamed protein product [Didymodactylos carnosus]